MLRLLSLSLLLSSASSSPLLLSSSSSSPSSPSSPSYDAAPTTASSAAARFSSLVSSSSPSSSGPSSAVFYVLPPNGYDEDGISALAGTGGLKMTQEALGAAGTESTVVPHVEGGFSVKELRESLIELGHAVSVVDTLAEASAASSSTSSSPNSVVICAVPDLHASDLDSSLALALSSSPSSPPVAAIGASSTPANRASSRRRRLDDAAAADSSPSYYVHMTPNILSGILFGFLFVFVVLVGTSCMNDIEGQTVFVSKAPAVGKEM